MIPIIPSALLTCQPEPAPPADPVTDNALAIYMLELQASGQDCRGNLAEVKGLLK